jgi:hypothetical protein
MTDLDTSALPSATRSASRGSPLSIPGLRDDAVEDYCKWHCSKVRSRNQKQQYELACALTLEKGFDLELVYEDSE